MEKFTHSPLHSPETQIRLLKILPINGDVITCELAAYTCSTPGGHSGSEDESGDEPEDALEYNALSYTWGPPEPTRTIVVNETTFTVRENLWHFLHHFATGVKPTDGRKTHSPRVPCWTLPIWIDQLCIDQSNNLEKIAQVQRMGQIYNKVATVVFWVGEHAEDSRLAIENVFLPQWDINMTDDANDEEWDGLWRTADGGTSRVKHAVKSFFNRAYFHRLWIAQEMLLGHRPFFACGDSWFNAQYLMRFLHKANDELLSNIGLPSWVRDVARRQDKGMDRFLPDMMNSGELLLVMWTFGGQDCVDPRDKVFGLLALVEDDQKVKVDYSAEAADVFWEAVSKFKLDEDKAVLDPICSDPARLVKIGKSMGVTGLEKACEPGTVATDKFAIIFGSLQPAQVFATSEPTSNHTLL